MPKTIAIQCGETRVARYRPKCFGAASMRECRRATSKLCRCCKRRAMREYAARRDWTMAVQIKEVGSGTVKRELRKNLLTATRRREIDVVLVW
jgi:hypothetical protein